MLLCAQFSTFILNSADYLDPIRNYMAQFLKLVHTEQFENFARLTLTYGLNLTSVRAHKITDCLNFSIEPKPVRNKIDGKAFRRCETRCKPIFL